MSSLVSLLLVDDDDVDVMALQRAFRVYGVPSPVVVAHDGLEAMHLLQSQAVRRPYLILVDLNMPRVNGIEFLDQLRADPEHGSAIVFVLTTSASEQDRSAAYRRNVAGYIVKSALSGDLKELVNFLHGYCNLVTLP